MVRWVVVARELVKEYLTPDGKCRMCNSKLLEPGKTPPLRRLNIVYKHFKEKHSDVLENVRKRLAEERPALALEAYFPRPQESS